MTVYEVQGSLTFCNATSYSVFEETETVLKVIIKAVKNYLTFKKHFVYVCIIKSNTSVFKSLFPHSESISALLEL